MRNVNELCSQVILSLPTRQELDALSDDEIEMLRRAGNTYDNMLYIELLSRREARDKQPNP